MIRRVVVLPQPDGAEKGEKFVLTDIEIQIIEDLFSVKDFCNML